MHPKRSSSELAVIAKAKDLAGYVFEATRKSPIVFRFTFASMHGFQHKASANL